MQGMKKKSTSDCNSGEGSQNPKLKERHIVTWSQEEDDILREQIRNHGTENWAIIASKFNDKTTRQCRRRWFTYLNSDFKKGGWSPEEDMLLCEAQRIYGNRWTEIAKVVSGRTDNAVKNRFTTLCKKRAKHEALAKENNTSYINLNNKRVIFQNRRHPDGILETAVPIKKMRRSHIAEVSEGCSLGEGTEQQRAPFAVLAQNFHEMIESQNQPRDNTNDVSKDGNSSHIYLFGHYILERTTSLLAEDDTEVTMSDSSTSSKVFASSNTSQGTFLKKDDPKIIALMQQAELLSSLALKVNTEHTDQSLENAWKVLQDFLNRTKESEVVGFKLSDIDFQLENFKDLLEDLRSGDQDSQQSWRQPDLCEESQDSSEYSTGSTVVSQSTGEKPALTPTEPCEAELQLDQLGEVEPCSLGDDENLILSGETTNQDNIPSCHDLGSDDAAVCDLPSMDFSSPLQVIPQFRSLAAGIPSPQFSESERNFLLKTLGMESASSNPSTKPSQPPPCKRALLHCL